MASLIDTKTVGCGVKWEVEPNFTRDEVVILPNADEEDMLELTLLGKVTATGKYKNITPSAGDGSQNAAGILINRVDYTGNEATSVALVRGPAMIAFNQLIVPATFTATNRTNAIAALAALGIKIVTNEV